MFTKAGALWGATPGLGLHRRLDKLNAHLQNMSQRLSDASTHCSYLSDAPVAVTQQGKMQSPSHTYYSTVVDH